jgi:tetrahydromethanopterin S-methyltransferase subunit D
LPNIADSEVLNEVSQTVLKIDFVFGGGRPAASMRSTGWRTGSTAAMAPSGERSLSGLEGLDGLERGR